MRINSISALFATGFGLFALFFMTGSLVAPLSGANSTSSAKVQVLSALVGLVGVGLLLATRNAIPRILGAFWLPLVPVIFVFASLFWSDDAALSFRRVAALAFTTAIAYWFALRFSARELVRMVVITAAVSIVLNFLAILAVPSMGIHQADATGDHHVGKWRGLFAHKNDFGRMMAFCVALLVLGYFQNLGGRRWRWLAFPLILLGAGMIAMAESSQAVLLLFVVPAAYIFLRLIVPLAPAARAAAILVIVPACTLVAYAGPVLFRLILEALGRDPTLTGRTEIWEGIIRVLGSDVVVGGGFGAGWGDVKLKLFLETGISVNHAHNGYLDLVADIGVIGVALALLPVLAILVLGIRLMLHGCFEGVAGLAVITSVFILIGNWAGSFLLAYNSLFWMLPVACYVLLSYAAANRVWVPRSPVARAPGVPA